MKTKILVSRKLKKLFVSLLLLLFVAYCILIGLHGTRLSKLRKLKETWQREETNKKHEKTSKIADLMKRKLRDVDTTKDNWNQIKGELKKTTGGKVLKKNQNDVNREFPEHPIQVLILAYPRTGSSLLGELLSKSPQVQYMFEPLHALSQRFKIFNQERNLISPLIEDRRGCTSEEFSWKAFMAPFKDPVYRRIHILTFVSDLHWYHKKI
ncbi:uncharacterized protein LOC111709189 isoform X2 [Eurytemora carolleeae]|uniref:uncharacterized protein LOC111709189 isoform X2 n=1 Tax=Eurytemora carolleeae TaxID=1294199 RepID=UPI000C766549|nr:uncharacterized protein LOC111709189 isoform X2 [Eurytemora carolleeae]|eukprot:XP_023338570.1 uncharacterized protein LOC111709189 isoform X2 [Eurytemora affinis]